MKTYTTTATHAHEMKRGGTAFSTIRECNTELKALKKGYTFPEMLIVAKIKYCDCFGNIKHGGYTVANINDEHLN